MLVAFEVIVCWFNSTNEIHRNNIATLMHSLKKAMLAATSGTTPQHGNRGMQDFLIVRTDRFSKTFHDQLLEIGRQITQSFDT